MLSFSASFGWGRFGAGSLLVLATLGILHCSSDDAPGNAAGSAGTSTGGSNSGGSAGAAGSSSGGSSGSGGSSSGGSSGSSGSGGSSSGGSSGSSGSGGSSGAGGSGGGSAEGGTAGSVNTADAGAPGAAICPAGMTWGAPLASASVAATQLKTGFKFIEGPVWLADQSALFFSDMDFGGGDAAGPPSLMHKLTLPSTFEDFIPNANANGLAIARDGRIVACTHDLQTLSYYDPKTKARTTLDLKYMGKHFNSPNDVTVRSDGHMYFTDPDYQLGKRTSETGKKGVYHVSPDNTVSLVDDTLNQPNGITLSPDEKTLYVNSVAGKVLKYPLMADGSTGPSSSFADAGGPDGMGIDCAGNLYVTSNGTVVIFSAAGSKIGTITGVSQASNVAFGGADRKTLFITGGPTLYTVQVNVPGYPY